MPERLLPQFSLSAARGTVHEHREKGAKWQSLAIVGAVGLQDGLQEVGLRNAIDVLE